MWPEPNGVNKAIESISQALSRTPDDSPYLRLLLAMLGKAHDRRFDLLEEPDDINKMIEYTTIVVDLTRGDDPVLPALLSTLGVAHNQRFKRVGDLDDLEKDIEYTNRTLAMMRQGHPDLPQQLANLAVSHKDRFRCLGDVDDIDKALNYNTLAVAMTPYDKPSRPGLVSDLGTSHRYRFERLGDLDDLAKAIECQSRGLTMAPDGHPRLQEMLANLAISHAFRFQRLDEPRDLDQAILYQSRALALTPNGHPHLSTYLSDLGASHGNRFQRLDELNDLERAIEYLSRALAVSPDGHPNMSYLLCNLGGSRYLRFNRLGNMSDLDKAIECHSSVLKLTTDIHSVLCMIHANLAAYHIRYYEHTSDSSHLQRSLRSYRTASKSLVGAPRDRFMYARKWAASALRHSGLNCIEAYQTIIDLLPQFIWFGATATQRYEDVGMANNLATDAAAAAIVSSNYSLALEWLEHARCVVWNQHLVLRSPLDQLAASHPSLAARLQTVSQQLHSASSESRESRAVFMDSRISEQAGREHRRLAKEYDELLNQARSFPGFENFLRPMKVSGLVCAARNGPVIAISCQENRCDALIILPEQSNVANLYLPKFTAQKAQDACSLINASIRRKGLRERGVHIIHEPRKRDGFKRALTMLWNDLVKPILDFLGYTNSIPMENLPHITWCPTGTASFLPLHAAGDYDQPHSRVFDYVISSYTPTLTALLASSPSTLSPNSRVLAIGLEVTPGHKSLPGTRTELAFVKSHVVDKTRYSQLMDAQATPSAVLNAMEQHDWVHLACHAHQNVDDPNKSGFFLHGGTLDLAAINLRSFKKKGLAFLSACQTATGDERLPDEAVHLASGMLMAGYSSVIATMWSVVDIDAPFIADKVYEQLVIDGKLGNGEAGKALHNAVAGLRDKVGEKEFERWVPYIHIGS